MNIKNFIFIDLETTGLPAFENNKTKITELSLISVEAEHILLGAVPRVQNKLNLCFNPWKFIQETVENITGLSNNLLENQSSFDDVTLNLLTNFLERLQKPICFVAHNGNSFDYPILRTHIEKIKNDFVTHLFCIDSLLAFRELLTNTDDTSVSSNGVCNSKTVKNDVLSDEWDLRLLNEVVNVEKKFCKDVSINVIERQKINETTPNKNKKEEMPTNHLKYKTKSKHLYTNNDVSKAKEEPAARKCLNFGNVRPRSFKLIDVYEQLLQKTPQNLHHAEVDVQMILECAVILGEKFVNWANNNAILFSQVPKMIPGRKITGITKIQ